MNFNIKLPVTCFLFAITTHFIFAQTYKIAPAEDVAAIVSGTSTLHDWSMNADNAEGEGQFQSTAGKLLKISKLSFSVLVKDLKSNEKMMDKNAYKALKSDEFTKIKFLLNSAKVGLPQKKKYPVAASGNLTIAGVTNQTTMDFVCEVLDEKNIKCTGSQKLKMSDYQVKPPTFFFGEMKTGNELTIDLNLLFRN